MEKKFLLQATIVAKTSNNKTANCIVTVKAKTVEEKVEEVIETPKKESRADYEKYNTKQKNEEGEKTDNTVATKAMPQTGEINPVIRFSIITIVILAGTFRVKYFRIKKYVK